MMSHLEMWTKPNIGNEVNRIEFVAAFSPSFLRSMHNIYAIPIALRIIRFAVSHYLLTEKPISRSAIVIL